MKTVVCPLLFPLLFLAVFTGVKSIIIQYKGHRGLSSEIFHFNENNMVTKSYAHYEIQTKL